MKVHQMLTALSNAFYIMQRKFADITCNSALSGKTILMERVKALRTGLNGQRLIVLIIILSALLNNV